MIVYVLARAAEQGAVEELSNNVALNSDSIRTIEKDLIQARLFLEKNINVRI